MCKFRLNPSSRLTGVLPAVPYVATWGQSGRRSLSIAQREGCSPPWGGRYLNIIVVFPLPTQIKQYWSQDKAYFKLLMLPQLWLFDQGPIKQVGSKLRGKKHVRNKEQITEWAVLVLAMHYLAFNIRQLHFMRKSTHIWKMSFTQ